VYRAAKAGSGTELDYSLLGEEVWVVGSKSAQALGTRPQVQTCERDREHEVVRWRF
jgi:hypothetical protein